MSTKSIGGELNSKTAWRRFAKMQDSEIDVGIAADSDARDTGLKFWEKACVVLPDRIKKKTKFNETP
ncbi:MAG TPA: hypothetical protein DF383_11925 [Deltaproteobacteria bacterium]|nr:hypothetical protein [Deltaproteobacteria bacterium]